MEALKQKPPQGPCDFSNKFDFDYDRINNQTVGDQRRRVLPIYETYHIDRLTSPLEFKGYIQPGMHLEVVSTQEPRPVEVGYQSYRLKELMLGGQVITVLDIGSKVISPDYQHEGIGTQLSKNAILRHRPNIVTGETANPNAYLAHIRTGYVELAYPNDATYNEKMVDPIRAVLGARFLNIDIFEYGLCIANYSPDTRKLIEIDKLKEESVKVLEEWKKRGFKLERGDEVRYWLKIAVGDIVEESQVPHLELAAA